MRFAIALFCFVALVCGQCTYYTTDPSTSISYSYDLSSLALSEGFYAYSYSDWNNSKYWIFNVCGNLDSAYNPYTYSKVDCEDDSAACYQYTYNSYSTYYSVGTYSSAVYADSMYGAGQGVSVTYTSGAQCGIGYRQSRFEFVCDSSYSWTPVVTAVDSYYCFDVITVRSSHACSLSGTGGSSTSSGTGTNVHPMPPSIGTHVRSSSKPVGQIVGMAIGSFVGTAILCTICVVCCVRRRQRCQERNQCQEMKNVAYSPVPQQPQPQPQQQPYMHPQFVAPQQYPAPAPASTSGPQAQPYPYPQYYFYVQPQQAQPQPVATKPQPTAEPVTPLVKLEEQVDNDEQLAKQLQAQFDTEAHN